MSTAHTMSLIQQQPVCRTVHPAIFKRVDPFLTAIVIYMGGGIVTYEMDSCKCADRLLSRLTDSTEGLG